ncbi:hypothetical protein PZ06_05645, partial [Lacticaseibacillus rhamnosus]
GLTCRVTLIIFIFFLLKGFWPRGRNVLIEAFLEGKFLPLRSSLQLIILAKNGQQSKWGGAITCDELISAGMGHKIG